MIDFLTQVKADVDNDVLIARATWHRVLEVAMGQQEAQKDADRFWEKAIDAEAIANSMRATNERLRSALTAVIEAPSLCVSIADAALANHE